jgi:hypothetical protein
LDSYSGKRLSEIQTKLCLAWFIARDTVPHTTAHRYISIILLILIAYLGSNATWHLFALYCISAWPLSVTHPLVGQRFKPKEAGRAIAFFNLLLFTGVFLWQWGFGLIISTFKSFIGITFSYQLAVGFLALFSIIGYIIFISKTAPAAPAKKK